MACGSLLRAQASTLRQDCAATSGAEDDRVVICEGHDEQENYSRRVHAFALVENGLGTRDVVPMVATNSGDVDDSDDDADDTRPLELVWEIPKAAAYGWFMATRDDRELYVDHGGMM